MNNKFYLIVAILFALTIFPIGAYAVNVASNGSFETGDYYSWETSTLGGAGASTSVTDVNFVGAGSFLYPTDGTFYSQVVLNVPNTQTRYLFRDSSAKIIEANTVYSVCLDYGLDLNGSNNGQGLWVAVTPDNNLDACNYKVIDGTRGECWIDSQEIYRFQASVAMTTTCFDLENDTGNNAYLRIERTHLNTNPAPIISYSAMDKIVIEPKPTIELTVTEPDEPVGILDPFSIFVVAKNSITNAVLSDSDIDVNIDIDGDTGIGLTYSGGVWTYNNTGLGRGNYAFTIDGTGSGFEAGEETGSISVDFELGNDLLITNISNAVPSIKSGEVNISPAYDSKDLTFKVENISTLGLTLDVNYNIFNGLKLGKQYWVYTSSNGESYTLNETFTFGASTNDGIQKIWDLTEQRYKYSYVDSLAFEEIKYYQLRFNAPAKYWETISDSFDWLKYSTPDVVNESFFRHKRDLYASSFETPLLLVTKDEFPDLSSIDLTEGFYLQFNAQASESFDLEVGYRIDGVDTTVTVPITTSRVRYSVPIDPTDNTAQLVITTNDNDPVNIYLSDYAIIPRSYFIGNVELFKDGGNPLDTIVRGGVSSRYIREALPTEFVTKFYDRERDLSKIIVQVILDGNIIKTYEDTINYEAMITPQDILVYTRDLSGIIDYSGKSLNPNGTGIALKNVVVKAILVNSSDQNVSEQFTSVKFLQYPYFQNDIEFYTSAINKKVGDNPKFALNFVQSVPEALIGFEVRIYSDDLNIFEPEYSTIIYTGDLGCPSLIVCSRTITIDEFAYSKADNWFITVAPILTTEEQDFTNSLTYKTEPVKVTYTTFETARMLQVFERTDLTYINSEQIPLVLQVRNDKLENLKNSFTTYLQVDLNDSGSFTTLDINFAPDKFVYDEKTGYNYWFWNTYFYDLSGNLVPDGNALRFKAVILPLTGKKQEGVFDAYGLVNKCAVYPSSFFEGTFLMNWGDAVDSVFGCDTLSDKVVPYDDVNAVHVLIDNAHSVKSSQNHSVWCVRTDTTYEFKQDVGDEFLCGVIYRKSEQMIDGFKVFLTNANSDFSLTGTEKQFIEFEVDQETIMFNDMLMLETALRSNFSTDKIDTLGEVMALGMNEILPFGQGIIDSAQLLAGEGVLIQNAGADINLEGALDPTKVSGMFFFKVKGLSVINVYDYSDYFEDADLINAKYFLKEANSKMIPVSINQAKITLYSSDFEPFRTFKIDSPLVVKKVANQTVTSGDTNYEFIPTSLKFSFIVDMFSNNEQGGARNYVPIMFTYGVNNFITLGGILEGIATAFSNPVDWLSQNWFLIIALIVLSIIVAFEYEKFKKNGD